MVNLTKFLFRIKPEELGRHLKRTFIDKLRVYVKSGRGGEGVRKLGGIGGDGGSIYLKASKDATLKGLYNNNLRKRFIALNGENSKRLKLYGENSPDINIQVPLGVIAVTDSGVVIGEVNSESDQLLISKGGKGGDKTNKYKGQEGQQFSVNLDLKLIADVGLIGFPNAGKSTFLSIVSRAQPKIANYPFTTLTPQLGIVEYDDKRSISIADLPGLLEGAHENRGMGHKFLKHITRTKINLFIVDIDGFQLNYKFAKRTLFETVVFLNKELELFDMSLINKPSILVINKMDTENSQEKLDDFMEKYNDYENSLNDIEEDWRPENKIEFQKIYEISAKTNFNVENLCMDIREIIDTLDDSSRKNEQKNDIKVSDNQFI